MPMKLWSSSKMFMDQRTVIIPDAASGQSSSFMITRSHDWTSRQAFI
jgi:hypothetical protein